MTMSETARRNHDELFPGHAPALARTDPEPVEVFDNVAFDETLQHGDVAPRLRLMTQLADVLDRIDDIVPPGVTLNPADNGWVSPALRPAARRR